MVWSLTAAEFCLLIYKQYTKETLTIKEHIGGVLFRI